MCNANEYNDLKTWKMIFYFRTAMVASHTASAAVWRIRRTFIDSFVVYCLDIIIPLYGSCVYCNSVWAQYRNRNNSPSFNNSINKHLAFMLNNEFSHLANVESFKFRKVMFMMSGNVYYYLKD